MPSKLLKYLTDSEYRFLIHCHLGLHRKMPDDLYLKKIYRARLSKEPDLESPKSLNEKLQWLKLHDRNPAYHQMADKAEVKSYVAEKIGDEYIIPTLGVYDCFDAIDFSVLPDKFVLKCTHDSGGIVICRDKSLFEKKRAEKLMNRFLKRDYYSYWREWPYKDLPHRIIAEKYIETDEGDLIDYKIHCFNGEPRIILVCQDRFTKSGLKEDFFNEHWEHLDVRRPGHPNSMKEIERPAQLERMLGLARALSKDIPFARIDLYLVKDRILFSEITFFPAGGLIPFIPDEWDMIFGDMLDISKVNPLVRQH